VLVADQSTPGVLGLKLLISHGSVQIRQVPGYGSRSCFCEYAPSDLELVPSSRARRHTGPYENHKNSGIRGRSAKNIITSALARNENSRSAYRNVATETVMRLVFLGGCRVMISMGPTSAAPPDLAMKRH